MTNIIKLKRSGVTGAVPSSLELGEPALNYADGKLFYRNLAGSIVEFGGSGSSSLVYGATTEDFPATGSTSNLYCSTEDNRLFRWDDTAEAYVECGPLAGGASSIWVDAPTSATSTGSAGQIAYDGSYIYLATGTNTWTRAAVATWSPFSPSNVSGLAVWLDASSSDSIYDATTGGSLVSADGAVARWEDKSGNNRHFTQTTSGYRPLRKTAVQSGKDVIRFDGTDDYLVGGDYLDLSGTNSLTAFVVLKQSVGGAGENVVSKYDADSQLREQGWLFQFTSANKLQAVLIYSDSSTVTNATTSSATVSASSFCVLGWKTTAGSASTSTRLYRNGSVISTTNTSATEATADSNIPVRIGAGEYVGSPWGAFNGDIGEILIYNSALSDTDRAAVESYLMTKWGIS